MPRASRVPTPFAVGRVNCYLIEDDPLTLVDTGPNSGKSLDELEQALAAHGRRVEDLELIVLTHQHIDHIGLAEILARALGRRGRARSTRSAPWLARLPRLAGGRRRVRRGDHAAPRHPARTSSSRCGPVSAAFRALGRARST